MSSSKIARFREKEAAWFALLFRLKAFTGFDFNHKE
jgi:hypothetical protein